MLHPVEVCSGSLHILLKENYWASSLCIERKHKLMLSRIGPLLPLDCSQPSASELLAVQDDTLWMNALGVVHRDLWSCNMVQTGFGRVDFDMALVKTMPCYDT
jgi:hypothetical protein